tara:strand:- start:48 stop:455 length:408 start_codon:yes stop_codon:yes gene_type:complete
MLTALFWKKVWVWIKHHWYVPVIFFLIVIFSLSKSSLRSKLYKLMSNQKDLYEKEKNLIVNTNIEKETKKEEVRKRHEILLKKLDEEHNVELEKLEEEKKEELSELVEKYQDDEQELAKRIAESLGVKYVEAVEE